MTSAEDIRQDVLAESRKVWIANHDRAATRRSAHDDDVADQSEPDRPAMRDRLLTIADLNNLPRPRPLIEGVFDLDNLSVTYGRRGSAKSFALLDQALCVASGIPWKGRAVTPGVAVYVAAEGVPGLRQRIDAWLEANPSATPGTRLLLLPEPVNLLSPSAVAEFAGTAAETEAIFVVLDTLARCLVGGDENSAKDMGIAVASMDQIRRATGAHVDAVHHSGKDARAGAHGSSALEAAADTVLEIAKAESLVTITTTKQKNRPEERPITLRAVPVGNSLVLEEAYDPAGHLTPKPRLALRILDEIAGEIGVSFTAWVEAAAEHEIGKTTIRRVRIKALEEGWIGNGPNSTDRTPQYVVTTAGRAIASADEETTDDQD